jgi:heparan-sulfate lyase
MGDERQEGLRSLDPAKVLTKLDLSGPGLEEAREAAERGDRIAALSALLDHYRKRYPLPAPAGTSESLATADRLVKHVFQWGPYEPADYGPKIDWEWDPRGDIEWVAAVYRFYWAGPLASAFAATRKEEYGRTFVELAADWIARHRLEDHERAHPVYTSWKGFVWLDIQTGIRATNLCATFRTFVHSEAFTPEFLGILLASLYDHQVKTERIPMGRIHNKAVFEQRGFLNVAFTFPEFAESSRWAGLAVRRTHENLLAQTTHDGVQREWSSGYHLGVLRDAVEIMERAEKLGVGVPTSYRERVRLMYDYILAVATPDLAFPMFGDCSRYPARSADRSKWELYRTLTEASALFDDPKYAARARLEPSALPKQMSYAFPGAGMYVMRSGWGTDDIHFGLHCSPLAISGHDQPDNGTFELYAFGRWLMPDTGYYTYGHDPEGRAWHRRTKVHQTLTLDEYDSMDRGRHLLWRSEGGFDALVVENDAYDDRFASFEPGGRTHAYSAILHRRSVWFVDRAFFVLLDEAIGDPRGRLDLHFQFAVGDVRLDPSAKQARTAFPDANVLVWADPTAPIDLEEEEGWFACEYGKRARRVAVRYRHRNPAPATFVTLLVPFRGTEAPAAAVAIPDDFVAGSDALSLRVTVADRTWEVGRRVSSGEAWCRRE